MPEHQELPRRLLSCRPPSFLGAHNKPDTWLRSASAYFLILSAALRIDEALPFLVPMSVDGERGPDN